jgi:FKBP-type peptidyl-prolyl cis-trans isomerase SlyD
MSLIIGDKSVVLFHYTLTVDGDTVDTSREEGGQPLAYLHGHGNIVPGLEKALAGLKAGDKRTVEVAPGEGYGEHDPRGVQKVPRTQFPTDVEIEEGMMFTAEDEDGVTQVHVKEVGQDYVVVDLNHPLAGETLHFDVEIVEVRAATPVELQHGHVHGPGGHHH